MATLLQYRNGQLVPVKIDQADLANHYTKKSTDNVCKSVYFQNKKHTSRKRLYGNLIMALAIFNAMLLMIATGIAA